MSDAQPTSMKLERMPQGDQMWGGFLITWMSVDWENLKIHTMDPCSKTITLWDMGDEIEVSNYENEAGDGRFYVSILGWDYDKEAYVKDERLHLTREQALWLLKRARERGIKARAEWESTND